MRNPSPTAKPSAAVPVGSWEKYQYTMSVPAKNTAQPMNRPPSTFIRYLSGTDCGRATASRHALVRWRWRLVRRRRRERLFDPQRGPALFDVRVVQVERRPLGPDPRDPGEVVPGRRAGRRPLQRVGVAPRVVGGDPLAEARRLVHVVEEEERGGAEDEGADAGDVVQHGRHPGQV